MNLWNVPWTTDLVIARGPLDDSAVANGGGRGFVGRAHRSSSDRLHHVLLRTARRRLAFPIRRDVLRGGEPPVSRASVRGAAGGGTGLHARGSWADATGRE